MDVIGSQINLTSILDPILHASSCIRICRPRSAALSFRSQKKDSIESSRPKSAEFFSLNPHHNFLNQRSSSCNENRMQSDSSSLLLSRFTDSSSKLLLQLLKEPDKNVPNGSSLGNNAKDFINFKANNGRMKKSLAKIQTFTSLTSDYQNYISNDMFLKNNDTAKRKKGKPEIFIRDSEDTRGLEERSERFSESESNKISSNFSRIERCPYQFCHEGKQKFYDVSEHDEKFFQNSQDCQRHSERTFPMDEEKLCISKKMDNIIQKIPIIDISESENEDEVLEIGKCDGRFQDKKDSSRNRKEMSSNHFNNEERLKNENTSDNLPEAQAFNISQQIESAAEILTSGGKNSEKCDLMDSNFNTVSSESLKISDHGLDDDSNLTCLHGSDSTYDEIIQLLHTLEEKNNENHNQEKIQNLEENELLLAEELPKKTTGNLNDIFAYLEEVEKDETLHQSMKKKDYVSLSLEKLLNKTSVELAHEVLSLEIQIEDQKKGISLLKDTIAEMKEAKNIAESEHQEILYKTSSDAETLVKRHQKFIKQLINEKKNLSEMISKLVHDLKSSEEKYKKNINMMEEKLLIEVKKAKNIQAAADKIKREKWMEMKTQKIKEMTVKGLEPELSRMAVQQQQELTELRNLHRAEIEALELKAARRTAELMDQLRTELTKEKENAITDKVNSLRASMEREFEEERNKFHQECQSLKQRIRKMMEKFSNQEEEFHLSLIENKQNMEKEKQKLVRIHQENVDEMKRRHSVELNNLKETLETDKNISLRSQERQLAAKFADRETELHEQYRKERDQDIEMVIEKFEKEQAKIQEELGMAGENKLKRVKEKLEAEIKELEANAADLKAKLSLAKSEVSEKEESITQLSAQIRQLQTEICFLRKSCEKMTFERTQLKETIRSEFDGSINSLSVENKNLQKEILELKKTHLKELAKKDEFNLQAKNEMQKEMTKVYSRIKAAISKKDKIIEALQEEIKAANERYRQLELVLDRQRRNLLLQ